MTLQDLFYLTGSIFFMASVICIIVIVTTALLVTNRFIKILRDIQTILQQGREIGLFMKIFIESILEKIIRLLFKKD